MPLAPRHGVTLASAAMTVASAFVLFFAMTPDAAARRAGSPAGLAPIPQEALGFYLSPMERLQRHLVGETYARVSRVERTGRGQAEPIGE